MRISRLINKNARQMSKEDKVKVLCQAKLFGDVCHKEQLWDVPVHNVKLSILKVTRKT